MKLILLSACFFLLQFFSSSSSFAQIGTVHRRTVDVTYFSPGHLDYWPAGYSSSDLSVKYPLMIYFMGLGTGGDGTDSPSGLERLYTGSPAPHEQMRSGAWVDAYTVPGGTYRFVIVTPQFNSRNPLDLNHKPSPAEVDSIITYAINSHPGKIDTTRIYLVGHSEGGGVPWEYAGEKSRYANRVAAILPISGVTLPNLEKARRINYANTAVWAFHNTQDNLVPYSFSYDFVKYVNEPPAPVKPAKLTSLGTFGHDVGQALLRPNITNEPYNVYQWLLLHQRANTTVFAGEDIFINAPTSSVTLTGSDRRPGASISSINWLQVAGPNQASLSSANSFSTTASGLVVGHYVFRLAVSDNTVTYYDTVAVDVNPQTIRIQGENFTFASPGVVINNSASEGEPVADGILSGKVLDYSVNVPVAGTYRVRVRTGSFYGSQRFEFKNASGNRLDTVRIFPTGSFDTYRDFYAQIPLQAGLQTIRIENYTTGTAPWEGFYLNWFELMYRVADPIVLPVNFSQFNVRCNSGRSELTWKTSAERNTKEFRLEKFSNGTWSTLGTVAASNQSSGERSYSYTDNNASGNYQYRIVSVDLDGRETLSPVIRSQCSGKTSFSAYPNPAADRITLSLYLEQAGKLQLRVYDIRGAVVKETSQQVSAGSTQIPFNLGNLPKGSYTIRASWPGGDETLKIIKE